MKTEKGFTLVELLVVISIIAILSVIGLTIFSGVQKSARDAKRKGDLHAIALALEQYKAQNGSYPSAWWANSAGILGCPSGCSTWSDFTAKLSPQYIQNMPQDPINDSSHYYAYMSGTFSSCSAGRYFILVTLLENTSDPAIRPNQNYYAEGNTDCLVWNSGTNGGIAVMNQQ